jgi:hypothetical protein
MLSTQSRLDSHLIVSELISVRACLNIIANMNISWKESNKITSHTHIHTCTHIHTHLCIHIYIETRRLKVRFCDVHCYATTSQCAQCIRFDRCYSTDTQQFLTVKRFLSNQIVATENTTVRKVSSIPDANTRFQGRQTQIRDIKQSQSVSCQHSEEEEIKVPLRVKTSEGQNSL